MLTNETAGTDCRQIKKTKNMYLVTFRPDGNHSTFQSLSQKVLRIFLQLS